jgi:hypothetical protein
MLEKNMRQLVKDLCADLDNALKVSMRKVVIPATLGISLALSSGCGVSDQDQKDEQANIEKGKADQPGAISLYAVPFPEEDAGVAPVMKYMGPFRDAGIGPTPKYMGPFMDAGVGPTPKYMGPFMDAEVIEEEDGGATMKYMGPFPPEEEDEEESQE